MSNKKQNKYNYLYLFDIHIIPYIIDITTLPHKQKDTSSHISSTIS